MTGCSCGWGELYSAGLEVAAHRKAILLPLAIVLDGYLELAQVKWTAWRRRQGFDDLTEDFAVILTAVMALADPALAGVVDNCTWHPDSQSWRQSGV